MGTPLSKMITFVVVVFALVGSFCYYLNGLHEDAIATERADAAARGVSVLPPGAEAVWLSYIDRQISATLIRKNGAVEVDDSPLNGMSFVSTNTPYEVSCDGQSGGEIEFGYGDNSVIAYIPIAPVDEAPDPPPPSIGDNDDPPPLGVDVNSIAGIKLRADLCERIVKDVSAVMQNPPGIISGD